MSQVSYKPDHMPVLSVYLMVQEVGKTLEFYEEAFGFKVFEKIEENNQIVYAGMTFNEAVIMFGPEGRYGMPHRSPKTSKVPSPVGLYLYCEDADGMYRRALRAGAHSLMEPQDSFWGDRICKVADPNGHEFMFATLLKK